MIPEKTKTMFHGSLMQDEIVWFVKIIITGISDINIFNKH